MASVDRSFPDLFQDIIRNVQEIVRSEIRLAKAEMAESAATAKRAAVTLGAGVAIGLFAGGFLLLSVVYALALVVPVWAAALIVGGVLSLVASATITAAIKQFEIARPPLERTVETFKENVEWVRQHTK
jgi:phosphotransferase system  glucose/maltose/N-acetylglucosamine-specific IIC component